MSSSSSSSSTSRSPSPERTSRKRKANADIEPLEVDITLPEPPSKKALRRLKKGKPLPPPKPHNVADSPEPAAKKQKKEKAAEESTAEKRSEHGIWIGNLAWTISKADLTGFFISNSDIAESSITRIHMPGPREDKNPRAGPAKKKFENKGFAYVDFASAEDVKKALELSESLFSGRRVLIKDAKSFDGRPEKKEETTPGGMPPNKRIFVGNLAFDVTEESLKEHFEQCGAVESVKLATFQDSGKCKGYGWVVFEELEDATKAVKGYIMKQDEEDEDDDVQDGEDAGMDESRKQMLQSARKTRKWWINKIKGRMMKLEYAEDAQVRYKKRWGGKKEGVEGAEGGEAHASEEAQAERPARPKKVEGAKPLVPKKVEYRNEYAPRLTGGIVESKGKKITF